MLVVNILTGHLFAYNKEAMKMSLVITLFALVPLIASARILAVPENYQTIQAAIDAAQAPDTVLVQPGIYVENLNFRSRSIVVAGRFIFTHDSTDIDSTIIDGGDNGQSAVTISGVPREDAYLVGFFVRNGTADYGGGVLIDDAVATVEYCRLMHNTGIQIGGAIACINSAAFVNSCTIQENETDNSGGGGIYLEGSTVAIRFCNISYNSTDITDGGAVYCSASNAFLINTTIAYNRVDQHGGALFLINDADITLSNSILWGNRPQEVWIWERAVMTVNYSDVRGGEEGIITDDPEGNLRFREGNFNLDPLFVNPETRDLRLSWANFPENDASKSRCIDHGDPESPRDPDETRADMGAFYFHQGPAITVRPTELHFPNVRVGDLAWLEVNIANVGGGLLQITSQTLIPNIRAFSLGLGGGAFSLRQGDPHQTWIRFLPMHENIYRAVLRIESNCPGREVIEIPIEGQTLAVNEPNHSSPAQFGLRGIYPNPFNDRAVVEFSSNPGERTVLRVLDVNGKEVCCLADEILDRGIQRVVFKADDLPAGIYQIVLENGSKMNSLKCALVK